MSSGEYRFEAREVLQGKWGKGALIILAYLAFYFVINLVLGLFLPESIFDLIDIVISVPIQMGIIVSFFKLYEDPQVGAFDFVNSAISNFGKSWGIAFYTILKLFIPILILVISSILIAVCAIGGNGALLTIIGVIILGDSIYLTLKSYYYQLAYIVSADNPEYTSKEAVEKSETLMKGNRWNLFCLQFSFIGWAFLSVFTLGIGFLWLIPYTQVAMISFYKNISNSTNKRE